MCDIVPSLDDLNFVALATSLAMKTFANNAKKHLAGFLDVFSWYFTAT
jgi:hypothetical protein